MTAHDLLLQLRAKGVEVRTSGDDRLVIDAPKGTITEDLRSALALDPGLEIDAVTRKGKNADGQNTFFVQAGAGRTSALTAGFPARLVVRTRQRRSRNRDHGEITVDACESRRRRGAQGALLVAAVRVLPFRRQCQRW